MKRLLTALVAATALGLGAPSAMAASAPQTEAEQRATEQWLVDLSQWASGYNAVMNQRATTLEWLTTSTQQFVAKIEAGQKDSARALAASVAQEGRRRLAEEMTAYQALPTEAPPFPLAHLIPPSQRHVQDVFRLMPDRFGTMMVRTDQAGQSFIAHLEAATSGRPEDVTALTGAYYDLSISRSEIAIALSEASKGATGPAGAAIDKLRDLTIEAERGVIVWMRYNRAFDLDEPFDRAEAAQTLRAHAEVMRRYAGELARGSNGEIITLRATPSFSSTPLGQILMGAHASFIRSADVERRMADLLDDVADAIELSETDPMGAARTLDGLSDQYEQVLQQRIDEDVARRRLVAQNRG